jgi:putative ABC transport system substrate-binding protein
MKRIGVLIGVADDAEGQARVRAFRQGLQDLGWVEGRNVRIDVFFAEGEAERSRRYATELTNQAPDVIVCNSARYCSFAATNKNYSNCVCSGR